MPAKHIKSKKLFGSTDQRYLNSRRSKQTPGKELQEDDNGGMKDTRSSITLGDDIMHLLLSLFYSTWFTSITSQLDFTGERGRAATRPDLLNKVFNFLRVLLFLSFSISV